MSNHSSLPGPWGTRLCDNWALNPKTVTYSKEHGEYLFSGGLSAALTAVEWSILRGEKGKMVYILVVDDDRFATTLVRFILSKEGYEVETTDNPHGAMQMIQTREPDLLILDVTLPYRNGFEFSAKLRGQGYEIPLIFLTAHQTREAKAQSFANGADDYLCKPYHHQELVACVEAVLRRRKKTGI